MKQSIFVFALLAFYALSKTIILNQYTTEEARVLLKNSINLAAHDASLQIIGSELEKGKIVFDQIRANLAFRNTLYFNTGLDPVDLSPISNTIYTEKAEILYVEFIDDNTRPGQSYPFLYKNEIYNITSLVYGPSVVYVVSVPNPRYNIRAARFDLIDWVVYEYPN